LRVMPHLDLFLGTEKYRGESSSLSRPYTAKSNHPATSVAKIKPPAIGLINHNRKAFKIMASINDVARYLDISAREVDRLIADGVLRRSARGEHDVEECMTRFLHNQYVKTVRHALRYSSKGLAAFNTILTTLHTAPEAFIDPADIAKIRRDTSKPDLGDAFAGV
jgi:hypothetical protein